LILYDLSDTVVAVSSPAGGLRSILRLTGPQALSVCERVFEPDLKFQISSLKSQVSNSIIRHGRAQINDTLAVDAWLYLFFAPHSYTGEDLAEIHLCASACLVEMLMQNLLAQGLRAAGPGEFTARAYLNGKLDLAQAEAVNEVISSSNRLQLDAAEQLLSGRLTKAAAEIHARLLEVLSLIEAGLDFSGEDIEFIDAREAAERLTTIQKSLEELFAGSIQYETLVDLPAVGIAGAPNAGKSSLLNALLGWERSIVSPQPKTTRDVLSGVLTTDRFQCVLFDCAGLLPGAVGHLDELAQRAAVEALQRCATVLFCVDATKPNPSDDIALRSLLRPKSVIHLATKADLLSDEDLSRKLRELEGVFRAEFLATSARMKSGFAALLDRCARALIGGEHQPQESSEISNLPSEISMLALTARHRQAVTEAIEQTAQAVVEIRRGNEEVAVVMIRSACQAIAQIEQQSLDEQVLDRIFSRFCIGK
jgi:tRNA modification GTPase